MAWRGARPQLGHAVQFGSVRCLGTFLDNPEHAPAEVVECVTDRVALTDRQQNRPGPRSC